MARITIEDCLAKESNRFGLVMLASARAKQLLTGKLPVTDTRDNKSIVSALREIAAGKVRFLSEGRDSRVFSNSPALAETPSLEEETETSGTA